jgi:glycosyltransferase involved in cell wall biosynthesis
MAARVLVLSSLFPSQAQPAAGIFIRERMLRVARERELVIVAPQPWFPGQALLRRARPHFRPPAAAHETVDGVEVFRPRFFSVPGVAKRFDGLLMALGAAPTVRRLVRERAINVLDVHFGYPDGAAGRLLARWLRLPFALTLRGKEARQARSPLRRALTRAVRAADRVITVSSALRSLAIDLGAEAARVQVIGNGVDTVRFRPLPRSEARSAMGIADDARMLISVGTLVERKGFHRVIALLPQLIEQHPKLVFTIVGGAGPEGDDSARLRAQVSALGMEQHVRFTGPMAPGELAQALAAADVFVLASRYEGWANVLLEAMACGLPVIATDVGGNAEVVCDRCLGRIVRLGDASALAHAIDEALGARWDRAAIRAYAERNGWETRIPAVIDLLDRLAARAEPSPFVSMAPTEARNAR